LSSAGRDHHGHHLERPAPRVTPLAGTAPQRKGGLMHIRSGLRRVGDVDLMVDDRAPEDAPAIVMAFGFSGHLGGVQFPDEFADALCARNWRVVRFDPRDIGLSTPFDEYPIDIDEVASHIADGKSVEVPYTLIDMADDMAGVVRSLGDGVR